MVGGSVVKKSQYCADPFKVHKKKVVASLRVVADNLRLRHPNLSLEKGRKLCVQCRKKLVNLPVEEQARKTSSVSTSEDEHVLPPVNETAAVASDVQDHELRLLNASLASMGETPVRKRRFHSEHYSGKKLRKVASTIQKKLEMISGEVAHITADDDSQMLRQLKDKFAVTNLRSAKLTILTVLPQSWTVQKIQEQFAVTQYMARQAKTLVDDKGILSTPNCRAGKSMARDVVDAVKTFYKSDAVSRIMPGKKDCVSVRKGDQRVLEQKHLVLCNLREAYQLFKEQFPEMKTGFSKFADMRPKECVLAGSSGTHSVCVCTIHQNVKLMMVDSRIAELPSGDELTTQLLHYRHCLSALQCNPPQEQCFLSECSECPGSESFKQKLLQAFDKKGVDEVEFKQWTSTDRSNLETNILPVEEFVSSFCDKLLKLLRHDFVARMQSQYLQDTKNILGVGEFLVVGDFAENYAFVVQDASQSFHWNNAQATLHPFVVYFREGGNLGNCSYVVISECNIHDVVAVHLFQARLVAFLKEKFDTLNKIIYFSDGCAAQYKNCKNFANLCNHEVDFGVSAEWHFFATSHGKGPCDGVGGTVKRLATRASLQRPNNPILTPRQFFEFAQETISAVTFAFTTTEDHEVHRKLLQERLASARTVPGM